MADSVDEVVKQIFDHSEPNWKPSDKIPLIIKEIELLKNDLKTFLFNSDYDISSLLEESEEICVESKKVSEDLEKCKKEIEEETMAEIVKCIENYDALSQELLTVTYGIDLVGDVIQCGKYIEEYEEAKATQSYTKSIEAVCDLVQYLERPIDGFDYLDISLKTRDVSEQTKEDLIRQLCTEWKNAISWSAKASPRKTMVTINTNLTEIPKCIDMLNALETCLKLPGKINELSEFLLKDVFKPIIYNECTIIQVSEQVFSMYIMHKPNYTPPFQEVLKNFQGIFEFLTAKLSFEYKRGVSILTKVGRKLSLQFSELLIKDCLVDTVPNNIQDLQTYNRVTRQIEEFQNYLVSIKFFPNDDSITILKYIEDIDVLFADRSSDSFLETARSIMQKDLSLSMSIGVESTPEKSSPNVERSDAYTVLDKTLPKSLFYFPRCMISKSAQELLDLVYIIMEQAVHCPEIVCKKSYFTTRMIFELYDAIVPFQHENYLQTIPQYVALFHNNCMYLAHCLQTLGDKWLTLMEVRHVDYPISFVDIVQKLRDLGQKHLTVHLQQQRKQILDNIRSSDLNCIVVKDVLDDNAEAAVRQCLRQLQLLKNVWIGVFPANVFTRLIATLVNMFVDELIHRVCTVEDISMEMATQLTEIYSLVVRKAPQLFQKHDIELHVKSWIKLQELIFILGGSLKDIENHWNDGQGPLAVHFRTEELRSLIKALFQNTQIRANLLSKIK